MDSIRVTAGTNQWITYTYDATGTLLRKKQYKTSSTVPVMVTDYIDGFVFENDTLKYFAAAEGRVRVNSGTLINEYVITDIQGNSRISFEDNGNGIAVVRQENSYYPFGLIMNNGITPATQPNKKLYNSGSEWQNDYVDLPDYYQTFFRNYDAAIGRFVWVDVAADEAESWTPYQYALNNPGMLNDPMGDLANGDVGIPKKHNPDQYLQNWEEVIDSEEYRKYMDDLLGSNGASAQRAAFLANSVGFQTTGAIDYGLIARANAALQPYAESLDDAVTLRFNAGDYFIDFNTLGKSFQFYNSGRQQTGYDIDFHRVFLTGSHGSSGSWEEDSGPSMWEWLDGVLQGKGGGSQNGGWSLHADGGRGSTQGLSRAKFAESKDITGIAEVAGSWGIPGLESLGFDMGSNYNSFKAGTKSIFDRNSINFNPPETFMWLDSLKGDTLHDHGLEDTAHKRYHDSGIFPFRLLHLQKNGTFK